MGLFIFFLVMVIVLVLAFSSIVALWVYKDAKARGERGWLWVCIVLFSSPLLGGLLYLLARRDDRRPCRFCGWMVDKDARFCSRCGKEYPSATRAAVIRRICRRLTSRPAAATGAFWRQCL